MDRQALYFLAQRLWDAKNGDDTVDFGALAFLVEQEIERREKEEQG